MPATQLRNRTIAAVLGAAVLGSACTTTPPASSTPDPEARTVYGQLFQRIGPNGEVDKQLALEAFALAFGPLPGVVTPQGPAPELHEYVDGTFALRWISRYMDELTAEQRAAVVARLTPGPDDVVVRGDEGTGTVTASQIGLTGLAGAGVAAVDQGLRQRYLTILRDAQQRIAQRIGRALGLPWWILIRATDPPGTELATAESPVLASQAAALGITFDGPSTPGCLIHLYPRTALLPERELLATLAHEMWHCYQYDVTGPVELPDWLIEGQAEWVGEAIMGPSGIGKDWWREYVTSPTKTLWPRTYDAVGFYARLAEVGVDPWTHMIPMLQAADNESRFTAAGAKDEVFLDTWAPSLVRDQSIGGAWYTRGLWGGTERGEIEPLTVNPGSSADFSTGVVQNWLYRVTAIADVVHATASGYALIGAKGHESVKATDAWLCTDGQACACPAGEHWEGPDLIDMATLFYLGVTGGLESSSGTLIGHDVREFCEPDEPTPGGQSPCAGSCSGSTGEPHLTTVDRVGYDFQAAGEYVLLRSADGSIEIQARQVPLPGDTAVSRNTAVAIRAGDRRAAIYARERETGVLDVRVDGDLVDATTPIDLGSGARIATYPGGVQVDLSDGTKVWAVPIGAGCCVNILVAPSDDLVESGVGLLGHVTAGGAPLPALPDGTRLPRPTSQHERFVQLYEQVGPAWLVTDETTLFDYEPNQSTADFVVPDFPEEAEYRTIEDLPPEVRAEGELACAGVGDPERFLECVFDVSVTDLIEWAEGYARTAQLEEEGPVAIGAPPPLPPPDEMPDGFLSVTDEVAWIDDAELRDDGRLYLASRDAADASSVMAVDTATGEIVAEAPVESASRIAMTTDAVWVGALENGFECVIKRLDPNTLAERASIPIPCDIYGTQFEPLADDIWFLDRTTADIDAHGGTLRRIDPATNQPGTADSDTVTVPYTNGHLFSSDEAIFWRADPTDPTSRDRQVYRLETGATELESLGPPDGTVMYAGGRGVWAMVDQSLTGEVVYRTTASGPDRVFTVDGLLIGADESSAWVSGYDEFDGTPVLLRYPLDGSGPETVATSVSLDTSAGHQTLDYAGDAPLVIGEGMVASLWFVPPHDDPEGRVLFLQAMAVP